MIKKIPKYKVIDRNKNVLIQGNILFEIIETLILNTIKHIETKKSLITRIEKNHFVYFDLLSMIYQNSNYFEWENIETIEYIYNNKKFLDPKDFVKFKKSSFKLSSRVNNIDVENIKWKR
ncbi:hypothetical protein ACWEX2_13535 [Staphylococcus xylosus]|uniref:Uncharacterized protein n=1 Tax=Staphylococcus xylosus TaxID=1288 RepID=A0AAQ0LVQ5_STAXY|nr:hypothetical protein [Staphylococcus xylosus]RIM64096.1 hypothetical protein BU122_12195 [Staphylococcus xylosus]RIM90649.1 hypothetical protein BU104_13575 [Staphylococcus xylosus]